MSTWGGMQQSLYNTHLKTRRCTTAQDGVRVLGTTASNCRALTKTTGGCAALGPAVMG